MPSAYDVYVFYLEPADLKGQSHTVKIVKARVEPVFDPNVRKGIPRIVLAFENRKKVLPLNKTQVAALIEITGTDDYSLWVGKEVTLSPAPASNRKETIVIGTNIRT